MGNDTNNVWFRDYVKTKNGESSVATNIYKEPKIENKKDETSNFENYLGIKEVSSIDYNNFTKESGIKNINNLVYDNFENPTQIKNINEPSFISEKEFEVLTDCSIYWVSEKDLLEISGVDIIKQSLFKFGFEKDENVRKGSVYYTVSIDFLNFVKDNTFTPKYIPRLCLLKTIEKPNPDLGPQKNMYK